MRSNLPSLMRALLLLTFFLMLACKTIPFNPATHPDNLLIIGEGGGFTGMETKYFITEKGDVFQQIGRDTLLKSWPSVDRQIVKQVIQSARQLDLINYSYQVPGNVYKFLTLKIDGKENHIVWGTADDGVNPSCISIYRLLNQTLQNVHQNE